MTDLERNLLSACKGLMKTLNIAFDRSEGDLLGVHHNQGMDAIHFAEQTIAVAEKVK